jgi:hypothetical protein
MIVSEEPTHSLGGYFYQKDRSPTRRNKKKQNFFLQFVMMPEQQRSKYFWVYTQMKLQIIRVMKQALKYIVEYLVKKRTPDTNYSFSHSHQEGFSINQRLCNLMILDIETVKQG